jgi:hypothetical protein
MGMGVIIMFQVIEKINKRYGSVKTVYAVKEFNGAIWFLFYGYDGWEWKDAEHYEPEIKN